MPFLMNNDVLVHSLLVIMFRYKHKVGNTMSSLLLSLTI